jgi:hypothetical protein
LLWSFAYLAVRNVLTLVWLLARLWVPRTLFEACRRAWHGRLWGKETRFGCDGGADDHGRSGADWVSLLTCVLYRLLCGFLRLLARRAGERELEIVVCA